MNRGVAGTSIFLTEEDREEWFERVDRVAQDGLLEFHCGVLMGNHFHFLVRSMNRQLSLGLKRLQGPYAQRFNRRTSRRGHLFERRFHSVPVTSYAHRRLLIPYIDWNPVCVGLARNPWEYAYGSARHYLRDRGPDWLTRDWVEKEVCEAAGLTRYVPAAYAKTLSARPTPGQQRLLERRSLSRSGEDGLDFILVASESELLAWLDRMPRGRASSYGPAIVDGETISLVLREQGGHEPFLTLAHVALLSALGQMTFHEIESHTGLDRRKAARGLERHRRTLASESRYRDFVVRIARAAIARCHLGTA